MRLPNFFPQIIYRLDQEKNTLKDKFIGGLEDLVFRGTVAAAERLEQISIVWSKQVYDLDLFLGHCYHVLKDYLPGKKEKR